MATIAVKLAPGEQVQQGDKLAGGVVKVAFPGEPYVVVERDDYEYSAFEDDPRVKEHRPEKTVYPMVVPLEPSLLAAPSPGDTFPMIGINEDVLKMGNWGANVVLAIVDTGVDARHSAFQGKNVFGDLLDTQGHGTHVASTSGSGIGIATDSPIFSKRVLDGVNGSGSESGVALGLQNVADWAVANKTNVVINMSLGGSSSGIIDAGVRYCQQRGLWVVAAAGNDGPNGVLGSPARQADFVVGAVDRNSQIASFSSGNGTWQQITCYMPGVYIAAAKFGTANDYMILSGTSMATPHLTGVLCLLRRAGMNLNQARDYIYANQTSIGAANRKGLFVIKPNFAVSNPPPITPPATTDWIEDVNGIADEVQRIVTDAQENGWTYPDMKSRLGSIKDYMNQIKALLPKVPEAPPPEVITPPSRIINPGQSATRTTSSGNVMRVSVPNTQETGLWTILTFAGTGFQGAQIGMLPLDFKGEVCPQFHMESVGNLFTQNGIIYAECAYRSGVVDNQVTDALAAFDLALAEAERWGGRADRVAVIGHSSGGFLCARIAEERPELKFALLMSGAALKINGYNWPVQSRQLLSSAGVIEAKSPYTFLPRAKGKMNLVMVVAMQDEQIPYQSELDFANSARSAGHQVTIQQVAGTHGASIDPGLQWAVQICTQN